MRHPLYAVLLLTAPPLAIIWLLDLVFVIPWAAAVFISHYVVRLEERGLVAQFGEEYARYRMAVPALLPYKGAADQRCLRDPGGGSAGGLGPGSGSAARCRRRFSEVNMPPDTWSLYALSLIHI